MVSVLVHGHHPQEIAVCDIGPALGALGKTHVDDGGDDKPRLLRHVLQERAGIAESRIQRRFLHVGAQGLQMGHLDVFVKFVKFKGAELFKEGYLVIRCLGNPLDGARQNLVLTQKHSALCIHDTAPAVDAFVECDVNVIYLILEPIRGEIVRLVAEEPQRRLTVAFRASRAQRHGVSLLTLPPERIEEFLKGIVLQIVAKGRDLSSVAGGKECLRLPFRYASLVARFLSQRSHTSVEVIHVCLRERTVLEILVARHQRKIQCHRAHGE